MTGGFHTGRARRLAANLLAWAVLSGPAALAAQVTPPAPPPPPAPPGASRPAQPERPQPAQATPARSAPATPTRTARTTAPRTGQGVTPAAPRTREDFGSRPLILFRRPAGAAVGLPDTLEAGTEVRVFKENAPKQSGRPVHPNSTPSIGRDTLLPPDTIRARGGRTAASYEVANRRVRYFVYARTPDGKLYWSVIPRTGAGPFFQTLDNPASIRMGEIPQSSRARLATLFPRDSVKDGHPVPADSDSSSVSGIDDGTSDDGHSDSNDGRDLLLLVAGLAVGFAVGMLAGHRGLGGGQTVIVHDPGKGGGGTGQPLDANAFVERISTKFNEVEKAVSGHVTETVDASKTALMGALPAAVAEHLRAAGLVKESGGGSDETAAASRTTGGKGGARSEEEVVKQSARVFVSWCSGEGRGSNQELKKLKDFTETLASRVQGAEVSVLYRDVNHHGLRFSLQRLDNPAEYWMVTVLSRHLLFPHPLNAGEFNEVRGEVFEGSAEPQTLRDIRPAIVRPEGAYWVLDAPGSLD